MSHSDTVDFKVMIHKIHKGAELHEVEDGGSYYIVGYRQSVHDYSEVHWPQDVRNCETCHTGPQGDNYKEAPSRDACGSCHDGTDFETGDGHLGGIQTNDESCATCHTSEGSAISIEDVHEIEPWPFNHIVELSLTPPANGEYYVAGEAPVVTVSLTDADTGAVIDPDTIDETWPRANLYVSGPRKNTQAVLTQAARTGAYGYYAENELQVGIDHVDDAISRTSTSILYQLDDVENLTAGTYSVFVETREAGYEDPSGLGGWALLNFQVGTTTEDDFVATNCKDCHADNKWHESFFAVDFEPDICKSCHDYTRHVPESVGWGDGGWNGFGAAPLVKKVHGLHYGSSLEYPEDLFPFGSSDEFKRIVFPQEVQNCMKCHSETDDWIEEPSRLACLACHDSDETALHADIMTSDPTPADPWSGDELESCVTCHGDGKDFGPDQAHLAEELGTISLNTDG
jgi:hypothetical protein